MPQADLTPAEQSAYDKALDKIADCRRERRTELTLNGLGLKRVPPEIGQLTALSVLELRDNHLSALPPEIGHLTSLTKLHVGDNHLTALPAEIGQLAALTILQVPNNQITTLPPELFRLQALTRLYLRNNKLSDLPPDICRLAMLTQLDLQYNQLCTLPSKIGHLAHLEILRLGGNTLRELPESILGLARLQELELHGNHDLGKSIVLFGPTGDGSCGSSPPVTLREALKHFFDSQRARIAAQQPASPPADRVEPVPQMPAVPVAKSSVVPLKKETVRITLRPRPEGSKALPPSQPAAVPIARAPSVPKPPVPTALPTPPLPPARPAPAAVPPNASAPRPAAAGVIYDVFISAKSEDYAHAREAATFLRSAGVRVFFSEQELPELGNSDYFDAIDNALEGSRHMLVVTTSRAYVSSPWVKKEWQSYLNEKLSGRKTGNLVTLLCGNLSPDDLPWSLRGHEARRKDDLASLLKYFKVRDS